MQSTFIKQNPGRSEERPGLAKASFRATRLLEFYLYFNAAGKIELHQLVHRLLGRAHQLDEALVDAHRTARATSCPRARTGSRYTCVYASAELFNALRLNI